MAARIGYQHRWRYQTRWHETKRSPTGWTFKTLQTKHRQGRQLRATQGAPVGSTFHWRIRARQHMTKVGPNIYRGGMTGTKRLISSRRRK